MKKQILLTISIGRNIGINMRDSKRVRTDDADHADPNGKWTIQYPTNWLAGHSNTIRANDSQSINESKFTPFDSGNVSIAVGIGSML